MHWPAGFIPHAPNVYYGTSICQQIKSLFCEAECAWILDMLCTTYKELMQFWCSLNFVPFYMNLPQVLIWWMSCCALMSSWLCYSHSRTVTFFLIMRSWWCVCACIWVISKFWNNYSVELTLHRIVMHSVITACMWVACNYGTISCHGKYMLLPL